MRWPTRFFVRIVFPLIRWFLNNSPLFLTSKKNIVLGGLVMGLSLLPSLRSETDPLFPLADAGEEELVNYDLYGYFEGIGTSGYRYVISDRRGLAQAVGGGIFPNETGILRDPGYRKALRQKKLENRAEEYQPHVDPQLTFYKWASLTSSPYKGLRLYMIGRSLEEAGHYRHALKAYYAVVIHFPKEICWQEGVPWYVGVTALDAIYSLLERRPELNLTLEGARIDIKNGFDKKATNDVFEIDPGRWLEERLPNMVWSSLGPEVQRLGDGRVRFSKKTSGHWQLLVNGKPYFIRGICYFPTPVGLTPDWGGYRPHFDWMTADADKNGRIDAAYDSWVDKNRNNQKDGNEEAVGDFSLLKAMGANTIRLYHHAGNKELLQKMFDRYGLRVAMGDYVGAYTLGSDAAWEEGTDYSDEGQRSRMRNSVESMVEDYKDEDYVLLWVLGNENNYGHRTNAGKDPETYYRFINSLARMIHELDPDHPVALCNGDLGHLELIARLCPDVDALAINAYRGGYGMGESFWRSLERIWKKPVFISEFGCPAFSTLHTIEEAEEKQADYLLANWTDIENHAAGRKTGNAVGGFIFEWMDEWWKAGAGFEPTLQDTKPQSRGPFLDGFMYEEWLGIVSQGNGEGSPFLRQLRPAYTKFKQGPWKTPPRFPSE